MKDRKDASHRLATSRSPGFCMNGQSIYSFTFRWDVAGANTNVSD